MERVDEVFCSEEEEEEKEGEVGDCLEDNLILGCFEELSVAGEEPDGERVEGRSCVGVRGSGVAGERGLGERGLGKGGIAGERGPVGGRALAGE